MSPREEEDRFRDIQERIARIKFSELMLVKAEKDENWEVAGMRDILAHEYFRVNSELVRATIDIPLANLGTACSAEMAK